MENAAPSRTGLAAGLIRAATGRLLALVYPPTCIACGGATADPHGLCPSCWSAMPFIERPYCARLGTPLPYGTGDNLLSPAAIADPPVFRRARAVARYDGAARDLVHRLKYGDRAELSRAMAAMMSRAGAELVAEADLVVPVPLHRWRLWGRRFNQAMLLAQAVAAPAGLPCEPLLLRRVKRTLPQVGLSRAQRAQNLQGAFRCPPSAHGVLEGRSVLLVDDVLTTGATANAASRALLRAGARSVDVLAFARVAGEP